jgi:hypothetical protein
MKYHVKLRPKTSKKDQQNVTTLVKQLGGRGMTRVFPGETREPLKSIYTIEVSGRAKKTVESTLGRSPSVEYVEPHALRSTR